MESAVTMSESSMARRKARPSSEMLPNELSWAKDFPEKNNMKPAITNIVFLNILAVFSFASNLNNFMLKTQ